MDNIIYIYRLIVEQMCLASVWHLRRFVASKTRCFQVIHHRLVGVDAAEGVVLPGTGHIRHGTLAGPTGPGPGWGPWGLRAKLWATMATFFHGH